MLVIVAVLLVAGVAAVAYILLSQPQPPSGPALESVTVAGPATIDQAANVTVTARAYDQNGVEQTSNSTFSWAATPSAAVRIYPQAIESTIRLVARQPGTVAVRATATWQGTTSTGQLDVTIQTVTFEVTGSPSDPLIVTQDISLEVRARRSDGSTAMGYTGTISVTSTDPSAVLPAWPSTVFTAGNQGSKTLSMRLGSPGQATVTATDENITSITGSTNLFGNRRPVPSFTATADAVDPQIVQLDARASSDPDAGDSIALFSWTFGDASSGSGNLTTHRYAAPGPYTIRLTVTDTHGASASLEQAFTARARPTAAFSVARAEAVGPDVRLTVNASASADPDGTIAAYNWTWGDGNSSQVSVPETSHVYDSTFVDQLVDITLRVIDDDGLEGTLTQRVNATVTPLPPVATFTVIPDQLNRTVDVDARGSSDPNGNIAYYNWTWGDGNVTNGVSPLASHAYEADGAYTVNLTVEDTTNLMGWHEEPVTISQPQVAPVAAFTLTRRLLHVDVNASLSYDPNGDIVLYSWDFQSDGTPDATGVLASFDYTAANLYTITLTVRDSGARTDTATKKTTVATSTLDYEYSDFFNVPYGEWWDYRFSTYGDLPINVDCFNATSIADGVCTPSDPTIPDSMDTPPYTNWYPLPGNLNWNAASNNPMIYAPYRFRATGLNVAGYNRSEPVFLPVLNYNQPAGSQLDFSWRLQYLSKADGDYLSGNTGENPDPCPGVDPASYDGFWLRNEISLTLDLQQSKRMFGVVATDAASAQTWWDANTRPECALNGPAENAVRDWFRSMAGGGSGSASVGKYDIANSYEWYYTSYYLDIDAIVDPDGTTHVLIDHAATGTEVLISRMFYWGNASYVQNHLDSTKARGWWGMELAWFEDFTFAGDLGAPGQGFNFSLSTAMQYQFQHQADPGPNGLVDGVDDIPFWTWGPILTDYTNDYFAQHPASELDRYPTATYIHSTPGGHTYGDNLSYDYAPLTWNLAVGQTWHFQFPTGDVVFYDPNLTPVPANPQGGFVELRRPVSYYRTTPANYGDWDASALTWDVVGPASTGGPVGSPGLDGIPGTADDRYALTPYGAIQLRARPVGTAAAFVTASTVAEDRSEPTGAAALVLDSVTVSTIASTESGQPLAAIPRGRE